MPLIQSLTNSLKAYKHPALWIILALGFSSGLPLALTGATLSAWLLESGADLTSIGLFAFVTTPYALKFLWAPFMDALGFPILSRLFGRRRGWILGTQTILIAFIVMLGFSDPAANPWMCAFWALMVAIASASQDIVIDAYRVEILEKEQYGMGAAMVQYGYRLGMLASGGLALILADHMGWFTTYMAMAALVGVGMATVLLSPEPALSYTPPPDEKKSRNWLRDTIIAPFTDFMMHKGWIALLLFTVLYKLGDAFLGVMTTPFLLQIGFSKTEIGMVVKFFGLPATLLGLYIGGLITYRLGTLRALWLCGIGHALTNLMFLLQAHVGADVHVLALGIALENISGGMTAVAFVAFLSGLTHVRFTATQYALLSSLAAFGRTTLSTPAGWFAKTLGWEMFFVVAVLLAIPGLAVLAWIQRCGSSANRNASLIATR